MSYDRRGLVHYSCGHQDPIPSAPDRYLVQPCRACVQPVAAHCTETVTATLPRYATRRESDGWHVVDTRTGETRGDVKPATSAGAVAAQQHADLLNHQSERAISPDVVELRAWRKSQQLTQAKLASRLGVAWLTVQRWEAGTQAIPPYLHLALKYLETQP